MARLIGLVLAALLVAAGPAGADDDHDDGTTTTTPPPKGSVGIGDGIYLTKAVVIAPDGTTRSLDARQAAVFVQSWLASAFFGGPDIVADPPANLPVYRVDSTGLWAGSPGNVTAYYATDGTTPYIGFPGMVIWTDESQVPEPGQWFTAPTRVIDTFQGKGELQDTLGINQDKRGPVTTTGGDTSAADSDSTPVWVWVAIAAGVLLVVGGGGIWLRRRRSSP